MRKVGHLPTEELAQQFTEYLSLQGISAVAREDDVDWTIWVHDEAVLAETTEALARFSRYPHDDSFQQAEREYARLRQLAKQLNGEIESTTPGGSRTQPLIGWRNLWQTAPLAMTVALLCLIVGIESDFGRRPESSAMVGLRFERSEPGPAGSAGRWQGMSDILQGQVWRLMTPVFLHLGGMHLLMNLMWFLYFAKQVETRMGTERMALLFALLAVVSNLTEFLMTGPNFLGLSGVCFGLLGYVWIKAWRQPLSGYFISNETVVIGMVILLLGFLQSETTGELHIANWSHLGGLLTGMGVGLGEQVLSGVTAESTEEVASHE